MPDPEQRHLRRSANDDAAGCERNGHHYEYGEIFPDQCNTCTCSAEGVLCSIVECQPQPDANPASCVADQACPEGPSCGGYCCGVSEHCVNDKCLCGTIQCGDGDHCAQQNPPGGDWCGTICCGASGPCPTW